MGWDAVWWLHRLHNGVGEKTGQYELILHFTTEDKISDSDSINERVLGTHRVVLPFLANTS